MFKAQVFRQAARSISYARPPVAKTAHIPRVNSLRNTRFLSTTPRRSDDISEEEKNDKYRTASTSAEPHEVAEHEGQFARTDDHVRVEYPDEHELPRSQVVQGRGAFHLKRTLDTFSLEGNVAIVTGGARGLGLVMGQALVASGADLAIVDLNSMFTVNK